MFLLDRLKKKEKKRKEGKGEKKKEKKLYPSSRNFQVMIYLFFQKRKDFQVYNILVAGAEKFNIIICYW